MNFPSKHSRSFIDWPGLLDPYAREDQVESTFVISPQALARVAQVSITTSELHYLRRTAGSPLDWLVEPSVDYKNLPPLVACLDRSVFLQTMFENLIVPKG